ncbi:cell division protein FtsA [Alteriqipengyuania sp. 357]
MGTARISRVFGAVNLGSFRVSAMIMGLTEGGELIVLGSSHRASAGVRRGYVTDSKAATHAIREAVERAEKDAGTGIESVWVGCAGAGLASRISRVEIPIHGRRIEEEDVDHLLVTARDTLEPDGRMVLHAQPAHYSVDGPHGVANPVGLYAEQLGVDVHILLADGAPIRNIITAVQSAHLTVEGVVAAPIASAHACLTPEERELGTALIEIGGDVTNVAVLRNGMVQAMRAIPLGSGDITDAIASTFGIRRQHAQRLKCVSGSALASPSDHREQVPVDPDDPRIGSVNRADLIAVITEQLGRLTDEIGKALKAMDFSGAKGGPAVLTGGGAELAGSAEFVQNALGRPVRIGKPQVLRGLPPAHATPGFSTLVGLCLYAAKDPVDIRTVKAKYQSQTRLGGLGLVSRVWRAGREYF